ncbi:serine hydrolase [Prauserella cavernicola]|uniref:Serine hydrolase n=1 Tax=Prauserella cavernicola TaxID=2800127 RepID=A0A934V268_9PSEU|nr:serine hydrolase [Prauserella cavernicola]MBK1784886.1 serine hydrolase [Prauserella cavernicola]
MRRRPRFTILCGSLVALLIGSATTAFAGEKFVTHDDLTQRELTNWTHRHQDEGYRLVRVDSDRTPEGTRYSATFRKHGDRPDWPLRAAVDARISHELASTGVPGIAVAVIQGGTLRYLRGFGHADVDDDVWMDGTIVGPYNSVSKAIAGALTFDVAEADGLDLDASTRTYLPELPAQHTHTVGQLLDLRGCVGHYEQIPAATFDEGPYASARQAVAEFAHAPLVCEPGRHWYYSTHSYAILGAVLESRLGEPIGAIVDKWITRGYRLPSVRPIDLADTSVRRMTLYSGSNTELRPSDSTYKVLGGGLEGSVLDMARFGQRVIGSDVLGRASLERMLTPPDALSPYAYGWATGTERGHRFADKDGSWPGSRTYLRIYPDDGLVVAVLTNRERGAHSAVRLGGDIGALVLGD